MSDACSLWVVAVLTAAVPATELLPCLLLVAAAAAAVADNYCYLLAASAGSELDYSRELYCLLTIALVAV